MSIAYSTEPVFGPKDMTLEEVAAAFYQLGARDVFDAPYRGVVDQLDAEQCEENRAAVVGFGKGYTIGGIGIDRVRREIMPHLWAGDAREWKGRDLLADMDIHGTGDRG